MTYYRLFLLVILAVSPLTVPASARPSLNLLERDTREGPVEIIAQGTDTDQSSSSSTPESDSTYDQAMQAGYTATNNKEYQKAQKHFQEALEARPNDLYAQQALQNVQFYIAQKSNPLSSLMGNSLGLWAGLLFIIIAVSVGLWFFLRRGSSYSQEKFEADLLKPHKLNKAKKKLKQNQVIEQEVEPQVYFDTDNQTTEQDISHESFDEPIFPENEPLNSAEKPEVFVETLNENTELPVQATTRIPSDDFVANLLKELQDTDPKKRRQAVWKLAQTADSRAMKPLVDLMIDTDSQERSLILEALSQISARTLKPMNHALTLSLQDKNPQVRKNAIRDLTRIYELMSQISQLLCHAIDDGDREVQETARWAINQLNSQIPPRLDILTGENSAEVTVEQSYSDTME